MTLILKNATFIDWKSLDFTKTNIVVEEGVNGRIMFTDKSEDPIDATQTIDCSGKYVTKSFAVGHHHVYSALARGMPPPQKTPSNFHEILKYIWWNLDKSLDKQSIQASALATAVACAKAGSTFVIDHHASPNSIEGSLEIISEAFEKVGIGHLLCYEISDRDGKASAAKGLDETEKYLQKNQGLVGLHASFTLGNDTMQKAAELVEKYNSGIHIHVAEDVYDQEYCIKNFNKRVVERLDSFGLLNSPKTLLVHCLHLDKNERELIKKSNAWVAENMESNLKNKVGYFNGEGLNGRVFFGTDGMHSDMIRSAQAAFFVGQKYDNIDYSSAYNRFRNAHSYLESNRFLGDGENNLVVLDYPTPTPFDKKNFLGHFIFGLSSNNVQHVISSGKLIVKDRKVQTVDEEEVVEFARQQTINLWKKLHH